MGILDWPQVNGRTALIELAWSWLRLQPQSALSQWFQARFGSGGKCGLRIGIVALACKLAVALWRYADQGVLPEAGLLTGLKGDWPRIEQIEVR